MKSVLIVGLGRFGRNAAITLNSLGHEIMAVDSDEERVNSVLQYVTNAQIGDSTNELFLRTLGIDSYDACIVAIGDNFQNSLETTSLLKELGAKKVVSRASTDIHAKFLLRNGADEVVYPEKQMAAFTAIRCTSDSILDYFDLDERYSIYEIMIPREWNGKTVLQLDLRGKFGINILGVRDAGGALNINISPDMVMDSSKAILILGDEKSVQKCLRI